MNYVMYVTCSFRESVSQIDAGQCQSVGNDDVDNNNDATAFKPKTEPDSPSHHQHQQPPPPPPQCGGTINNGPSSQSSSWSSGCEDAGEPHHVTSSHLLSNHQLALPHHYQHQQMSSAHHPHHLQHQQHGGYGMPASCAMGLDGLDAAVGFAAAAAAQCAGRSFTPTSPFSFAPAHLIGATYYDAVRQAGFDNI